MRFTRTEYYVLTRRIAKVSLTSTFEALDHEVVVGWVAPLFLVQYRVPVLVLVERSDAMSANVAMMSSAGTIRIPIYGNRDILRGGSSRCSRVVVGY